MTPEQEFEPGSWTDAGNSRAILYAMEYETSGHNLFSALHDQDVSSLKLTEVPVGLDV